VGTQSWECGCAAAVNNSERYAKSCGTYFVLSVAPDECTLQSVGDNPCGFCGLDGCLTQLLEKKGDGIIITSNCKYHYILCTTKFSRSSPCTNVPIHCLYIPLQFQKPMIWQHLLWPYFLLKNRGVVLKSPCFYKVQPRNYVKIRRACEKQTCTNIAPLL